MSSADLRALLDKVATGGRLSEAETAAAFDAMMSGDATPAQMGGFLMALRVRGETVEEITGAARTMRAKALAIDAPDDAIDIVGTGGDGQGSFNISSAAALVVAGCGVTVAKHGNRKASSLTGAADVLEALGVNIGCDMSLVRRAIVEAGIGFLMAQRHHSAMRHVAPTRVELGTRTIFNLLGPLANPAGTKYQLVGVFSEQWVEPIARVLGLLGAERAWVVHGADGLDELTTTGISHVAVLDRGEITTFRISPRNAGLPDARPQDLIGGDAIENAAHIRAVLQGNQGPLRDIVLLNAAAALLVAGKAKTLREGVALAAESIDCGKAKGVLDALVALSRDRV
jgi:anthranilate phosphoribosyltransferase